jgi:lycopene cyclase domain-containing protein
VNRYQYLALMAGCVVLTLPLEVLLGARVYRQIRRVVVVLAVPVVAVFVADVVAIRHGLWTFNSRYVTGVDLPGSVPVEEVAFFVVIPLCTLLTFEVVRGITSKGRRRDA